MANPFKMLQQAAGMKKEMKNIQDRLATQTVDHTVASGKITVTARGDMTIESVKIDPAALEDVDIKRLQDWIMMGVNGALGAAKKKAAAEMKKLTAGMDLGGLM